MGNRDVLLVLFGSLAFLALVVAPTFFLMGTTYQQTYWDVFGLDPGLFVAPQDWAGVVGFVNTTALAPAAFIVIAGYALCFVAARAITRLLSRGSKTTADEDTRSDATPRTNDSAAKVEKQTSVHVSSKPSDWRSILAFSAICAVAIIIGATVLALHQMQEYGRSEGEKDLRSFAHGDPAKNTQRVRASIVDRLHGNNVRVLDGYRIRCSAQWCAFYLSPIVEIVRTDDILSISLPSLATPP